MKNFLFLFYFSLLISCHCNDPEYDKYYGTWTLVDSRYPSAEQFIGKGKITLKSDKTFVANFSYFFTLNLQSADDSLSGKWSLYVENIAGKGCNDYFTIEVNEDYKEYGYSMDNDRLSWGGFNWKKD